MHNEKHKAGFVHLIGAPNAGKSTLLNALVRYPLSIATHKPQTTRHNILGIYNEADLQIVYLDTPGYLTPTSQLQQAMMQNVTHALQHSDLFLLLIDSRQKEKDPQWDKLYAKHGEHMLILLNKIDLLTMKELTATLKRWQEAFPKVQVIPIAALHKAGLSFVEKEIKARLPYHPPYYDKEELTDKSQRFLLADIIRKYIFLYYKQEIPYSTEVMITHYKETEERLVLEATIYVEKKSQKSILIGKKGSALKKVGTAARKEMMDLCKKRVFLAQHVKISPQWRNRKTQLAAWGYQSDRS